MSTSDLQLRHVSLAICPSASTGRFFTKFGIWVFFRKSIKKNVSLDGNVTSITGTLHEDACTFVIICRRIHRLRNLWAEIVEKIRTHILCPVTFFFFKNRTVYEVMWRNDNIVRRMRCACRVTRATNTDWKYIILRLFGKSIYANAPECYIIRTLPVLLHIRPCVIFQFIISSESVHPFWQKLEMYGRRTSGLGTWE